MLTFESSLTDEEIAENFKNISFFDGLMNGLNEALAYGKGSAKAAANNCYVDTRIGALGEKEKK